MERSAAGSDVFMTLEDVFIMKRERFYGAHIAHLLLAQGHQLD